MDVLNRSLAYRNVRFRTVLNWMSDRETTSAEDVTNTFGVQLSSARKILRDLRDLKLILYRGEVGIPIRGRRIKTYALAHDALATLPEVIPVIEREAAVSLREAFTLRTSMTSTPKAHVAPEIFTHVEVQRDPLVAYICGMGRAPSLNFMDSLTQEKTPC